MSRVCLICVNAGEGRRFTMGARSIAFEFARPAKTAATRPEDGITLQTATPRSHLLPADVHDRKELGFIPVIEFFHRLNVTLTLISAEIPEIRSSAETIAVRVKERPL
jgi:hypothetical protein